MTSKWRRTDVDATPLRRIDVNTTLFWRHMPAGNSLGNKLFTDEWMDDATDFYVLFNGISVTSGRWACGNESLYAYNWEDFLLRLFIRLMSLYRIVK